MGYNLSTVSFTAQVAPIMKRATATLSDGTAVAIVPDPNITTQTGADDVTGTAKIRVYKSSDTGRTTWSLNTTLSTAVPSLCSSSIPAILSMVLDSSNNMHIVYAGTDNSLRYAYHPFSAGTWGAGTNQIVVAANAVTKRYRAVDIDVPNAGTLANVAIIAYESKASAGPSAWIRVFIRNNDGTTWRTGYTEDQASLAGGSMQIASNSEDVSISWGTTGITANVGQLLIYACRIGVSSDHGDQISELQYNVSTGTDGSATVLGTWPLFNQNVGGPYRRGWIYKTANNIWQVAMVAGLSAPKLSVMRLTHSAYGPPFINSITPPPAGSPIRITLQAQLDASANSYDYVACTYNDNRVMFGFITRSAPIWVQSAGVSGGGYTLSGLVFRYNDISTYNTSYQDIAMRPLDGYFSYGNQPIALYGAGNNRNQANDFKFNFLAIYGYAGNDQTGVKLNKASFVLDTFYDPPTIVAPTYTVANDKPILFVYVQNSALYPNIRGKIEWTLARDFGFTVDSRAIVEPDSNYQYFGSTTASAPPGTSVSIRLSGVGAQKLYSGKWYMRARVVSDLGQVSAWSTVTNFTVAHQPTANPVAPQAGSFLEYGTGNLKFSWQFSDTESTDTQTSYQLLIQRSDTGATVYDSGKTASSQLTVTVALSAANKDLPLQWTVSLWDTDDVQGPFSNPVLFVVGDSPSVAITSPTNGATVTSAAPTVSWVYTGAASRPQRAYRVYVTVADVLDTYVRSSVVNGWGISDDGETWTNDANASSSYSTNGSVGQHTHTAVNTRLRSAIGVFVNDSLQKASVTIPVVALGAPIEASIISRRMDANNYYYAGARFGLAGAITLFIAKRVGGVETDISTVTIVNTYTAASSWNLRFYTIGSQLQIKIFQVGSAEQTFAYGLTANDSALRHAGQGGLTSILATGNTNTLNQVISWDNYAKTDPSHVNVGESGWILGTASSYTFPANILQNNSFYDVVVAVQDTGGMQAWTTSEVPSVWTHPALGAISIVTDNFGPTISWDASTIDSSFVSWRLYRRYMVPAMTDLDDNNTANSWVLLYETNDNVGPYSFKDYLIPLNKAVDYAVVQLADRFGSLIESKITTFSTVTMTANRYFFIPSVPIGTIASYEAANVSDDSWSNEVEQQTLHVIGRGRQVQIGDDLGASGTLTIQLRNPSGARADREFIQRLASSKVINVWMKNPFGDIKYVKFGNVSVKFLAGTGQTELSDLTVPYTEVFAPSVITRAS